MTKKGSKRSHSEGRQPSADQKQHRLPGKSTRKEGKEALASRAIAEEDDQHIVPAGSASNTLAASVLEFLKSQDESITDKAELAKALKDSKLGLTVDPSDQLENAAMLAFKAYRDGNRTEECLKVLQNAAENIAAANELVTTVEFLKMFENKFADDSERPFVYIGLQSGDAVSRLKVPFPHQAFGHTDNQLPQLEDTVRTMPVLYGESGSGKTHAAMASNKGGLVVYLLVSDMEEKYRPHMVAHDKKDAQPKARGFKPIDNHNPMLQEFVNDVTSLCKSALDGGETKEMRRKVNVEEQMKDVVVRVVADELGDKPSVLRLFIRTQQQLREAIRKALKCKAVKLLAVGTGVNERVALGSNVNSYNTLTLDPGDANFVEWLLPRMMGPYELKTALVGLVIQHRSLGPLVENRRAAVLVVKHLAPVVLAARVTSVEQLTSLVNETADMIATSAAFDFKGLNSLERLNHNPMKRVALDAIEFVRSGTKLSTSELQRFSASYGILVNTSVNPNVQKLALSPAMRALLLVILGCPQHNCSIGAKGEALEKILAKKCAVALLTTRDPKLLSKMLHTNRMVAVPKASSKPVPPSPEVVMMELTHWLSGAANATQVNATLQTIRTHVNNGEAVVVINGSVAPYADVVAVTKGFVGFFQSKDTPVFEPNKEANKLHTEEEEHVGITSQGVTNELCRIAGVESKGVKLVIVSSACRRIGKKDDELEVGVQKAQQVLRRESDEISFLFPFDWPKKNPKVPFKYTAAAFNWKPDAKSAEHL